MKISRLAGAIAGLFFSFLLTGCGDTYRPVISPFPSQTGDPKSQTLVLVANQGVHLPSSPGDPNVGQPCLTTDVNCTGSVSDLDVAGDVNAGNHVVGEMPWASVLIGSSLFVANRGSNTISTYSPFIGNAVSTISLRTTLDAQVDKNTTTTVNVAPVVALDTKQGTLLFAVLPALSPASPGVMATIDLTSNLLSGAFLVGNDPVSVTELPDLSKVYVVNRGSNSLTVFAASDRTNLGTISVGAGPVLAIPTPDSQFLFVLNRADSTVSVVKTSTNTVLLTAGFGTAPGAAADIPLQHPMFYDTNKTRLYVTNSADDTVTIFDASNLSGGSMNTLATVHLPAGSRPSDVTVLRNDGSRAYVLNQGNGSSVGPSVSVINASDYTVSAIPDFSGTSPRTILSSADGSKVYVINHDPTTAPGSSVIIQQPGTNIIRTGTNTFLKDAKNANLTLPAPFQDIVNCQVDTPQPWKASTAYVVGATAQPTVPNGHAYQATIAGTSGATAPAFCTTSGCQVTDGSITWKEVGSNVCPRQRPAFASIQ